MSIAVITEDAATAGFIEDVAMPPGTDADELVADWKIGFLLRACVTSLPERVELDGDVPKSMIAVNVEEAEAAMEQWWDEHPFATEEESQAVVERMLLETRFRLGSSEEKQRKKESGEADDEAKYMMFEVDQAGRIVPQQ